MRLVDKIVAEISKSFPVPDCWPVTPKEYAEIAGDERIFYSLFSAKEPMALCRIMGVPVVVIPFADDPKFKQLQAMAALAGEGITYHLAEGRIIGARFSVWEFLYSSDGRNILYPLTKAAA